jgi:hypothetical protein
MDKWKWKRNICLMVLGAFNAESLSGATPPYKWVLDPWSIFVTFMFYGLSLLVIEDLVSRYSLDYRKLLLMGFIYGILEEGFLALTNLLPGYSQIAVGYGRYLGLNVPWAVFISEFHAIYTVVLTFMIADIVIPRRKAGPVLSKWQYVPVLGYLTMLYLLVPNYVLNAASTSQHFALLIFRPEFFLDNFILINAARFHPTWESIVTQLVAIFVLSLIVIRLPELNLNGSKKEIVGWKVYVALILVFELMFWTPYILKFLGGPDFLAVAYYLFLPFAFWKLILSKIRKDDAFNQRKVAVMALTLLLFFGGVGIIIYCVIGDLISLIIVIIALWIEVELVTHKYYVLRLFKR